MRRFWEAWPLPPFDADADDDDDEDADADGSVEFLRRPIAALAIFSGLRAIRLMRGLCE